MGLLIGIILAIPLGLIPAFIAKNKGHSFGLWWLYGWALFIVAIIHVMFIEDRTVTNNQIHTQPGYPQANYPQQTIYPQVNNTPSPAVQPTKTNSSADELRALKELLDSGIITQEEFDAKKKQILGL